MPIAYLIQARGRGLSTKLRAYHLHLADEPDALCSHVRVGPEWRSVPDLNAFLRTPEGLFVRHKRCCAICAALRQPYERLDRARLEREEI